MFRSCHLELLVMSSLKTSKLQPMHKSLFNSSANDVVFGGVFPRGGFWPLFCVSCQALKQCLDVISRGCCMKISTPKLPVIGRQPGQS